MKKFFIYVSMLAVTMLSAASCGQFEMPGSELVYSSGKTVNVNLVAGKTNNITCTLTGDGTEVEFGVSLTAWSNNAVAAGTFLVN